MLLAMSPGSTQYLQVPKTLPHRKARARSKSQSRNAHSPRETSSSTEVIVSPIKLSFRHQSPPSMPLVQQTYRSPPPTPNPEKNFAKLSLNVTESPPSAPDQESAYTIPKPLESAESDTNAIQEDSPNTNPPIPPTPEPSLRQTLIGTWKLESYITYPTPTSTIRRPTYPMTKNVTGLIMYTPDGYMSAQMYIPGQKSFARGEAEEAQWAEAAKRCFSYCGPYYISNEGPGREEVLRHTFQFCSLPGWVGDVQVRTHRFEEDGEVLVLGSEEEMEIKGDKRIPVLKWKRARENSGGVPPPPTPKIKISGPGEP